MVIKFADEIRKRENKNNNNNNNNKKDQFNKMWKLLMILNGNKRDREILVDDCINRSYCNPSTHAQMNPTKQKQKNSI